MSPAKTRLSASVDPDLVAAARRAVRRGDADNVSAWVNHALRRQTEHDARLQALDAFVVAFEAEHGAITDVEMASAVREARARAAVVRGRSRAGRSVARRGRT